MDDFAGKVAVVTGGASGIGRSLVRELLAAGAKVVIGDVEQAALDRVLSDHLDRVQEKLSADVDEKIRGLGDLYGVAVTQLERRAQLWLWAIGVSGIFAMVVASGLVRWPFW